VRVAVLGTGTMGAPMAQRVAAAGHDVRVWNRTPEKAEQVGLETARTPADAVPGAEVAITMLADGPAVDETIRQALPRMDGTVWAQMSTVGVEWADRLRALADEHGVALVDAPVMGSRPQAEQGQLLPLAAGSPKARERCRPVFEAFSRDVLWLGDEPGLGSRLKLVVNHWLMVSVENAAETVVFAESLGVDARRFFETIEGAAFDMRYARMKGELMLKREFPAAFTLRLAQKDLRLAAEAAQDAGVELALAAQTLERMQRAIDAGHGDEDFAAVYYAAAPQTK
jgi:3-hydroxyisobutyrate dehydrogenase